MSARAMTAKGAMAEAKRRWASRGDPAIQDGGKRRVSTPDKRAEALQQLRALRESLNGARPTREQRAEINRLFSAAETYRYTVGYLSAIAFHVRGRGDTWEAAFQDAERCS